jgi:uncharacterized membrane protein YgdD (TMEM256/DUF423 family)
MKQRQTLLCAALLGFLGVALGAFGAHAFKPMLVATNRIDTFELAVRYTFYHALALLAVGLLQNFISTSTLKLSALFFMLGVLLFSGSLYLLCFTRITTFAMVTPIGGLCLLCGWILLAWSVARIKSS